MEKKTKLNIVRKTSMEIGELLEKTKVSGEEKKRELLEKAEAMCKKYPNNRVIQSQRITILIMQSEYEEARKIGERFPDDERIQFQIAMMLIDKGNYERAKKIAEKFPDNERIQSQMITILIHEGNYEKAKEIGARFRDYPPIQSQIVTILMHEGNHEKAKEIGERLKDYPSIQSQIITILTSKGNYEEAKEIGKRFPNNVVIEYQMKKIQKEERRKEKKEKEKEKMIFENGEIQEIIDEIIKDPWSSKVQETIQNIGNWYVKSVLQSVQCDLGGTPLRGRKSILSTIKQNEGDIDDPKLQRNIRILKRKLRTTYPFFNKEIYIQLLEGYGIEPSVKEELVSTESKVEADEGSEEKVEAKKTEEVLEEIMEKATIEDVPEYMKQIKVQPYYESIILYSCLSDKLKMENSKNRIVEFLNKEKGIVGLRPTEESIIAHLEDNGEFDPEFYKNILVELKNIREVKTEQEEYMEI